MEVKPGNTLSDLEQAVDGFERIGSVLTLSPSNVEKYLAAAETIPCQLRERGRTGRRREMMTDRKTETHVTRPWKAEPRRF